MSDYSTININNIYDGCYNKAPGALCTRCVAYGFCMINKRKGISYDENLYLLTITTEQNSGMTYQDIINHKIDEYSCLENYMNSTANKLMLSFMEEYERKFCR